MQDYFLPETKIRVGKIDYVNTLPFFCGLEFPELHVSFVEGVPTQINKLFEKQAIDIGLISSLAYGQQFENYLVLPELCIASREQVRSVSLLSRLPIQELNHRSIAISHKSLSAAYLLRILLRLKWQFQNEFVVCDVGVREMLSRYPACLLIGDDALFFDREESIHEYDLSQDWCEWTGFPFCFALWVVRGVFYESFPEAVHIFFERLLNNVQRNLNQIDAVARSWAESRGLDYDSSAYLRSLEFRMDPKIRKGLELFFKYAAQLGYLAEVPRLRFLRLPEKEVV